MCCCGGARGVLWSTWSAVSVVGIVYMLLSFTTFGKVYAAYKEAKVDSSETLTILAATMVCGCLVLIYSIFTLLLLLGKSTVRARAGFMYGFLASSGASLSVMVLLCSLLQLGYRDDINTRYKDNDHIVWRGRDTAVFDATTYMGFISSAGYLALFGVMVAVSGAIDDIEYEAY